MVGHDVEVCSCCNGMGSDEYGFCPLCNGKGCPSRDDENESPLHDLDIEAVARAVASGFPTTRSEVEYEIVCVPGKGAGVKALGDFKPGQLILAEAPLLTVCGTEAIRHCIVQAEDPNDDVLALRQVNQKYSQDKRLISAVASALEDISMASREEFLTLADSFTQETQSTLGGIFITNAVADAKSDTSYVYAKSSRVNHSCRPNAVVVERDHSRHIYAASNISAGDEICISYIEDFGCKKYAEFRESIHQIAKLVSLDCELLLIGLFRQQLFVKWGFWCQCKRCAPVATDLDAVLECWAKLGN